MVPYSGRVMSALEVLMYNPCPLGVPGPVGQVYVYAYVHIHIHIHIYTHSHICITYTHSPKKYTYTYLVLGPCDKKTIDSGSCGC